MKKSLKIAYLITGENLASPLLRRQVVELLGDIRRLITNGEITVFLFYSVPTILAHRHDIAVSRKRLSDSGIRVVVIPTLCPWPIPNPRIRRTSVGWRPVAIWGRWTLRIFKLLALPFLAWLRVARGYTLFHCRSYPSTSAAVFLKQFIPTTSVLFDPRSDFPEENVTAGNWKRDSRQFRYWKREEARLLEGSDYVACIGPSYVRAFQESTTSFNYFIAPNNVRCDEFRRKNAQRETLRRSLGIQDGEIVFAYLGTLTATGWHRPDLYRCFYKQLVKSTQRFRFLFLVPDAQAQLVKDVFHGESGVIVASPSHEEVGAYLTAADVGMMFLQQAKIALGTKIPEYLAASLPVLVNENCRGAVDLLDRHPHLGMIVNLGLGDMDKHLQIQPDLIERLQERITSLDSLAAYAVETFDNAAIAKQYTLKYRQMTESRYDLGILESR